ncbi:MAG: hypothetical protein ACPLPT_02675 [Moorellales bacterium]
MWRVSVVHADGSLRWQSRLQQVAAKSLDIGSSTTRFLTSHEAFVKLGWQLARLPTGIVFLGSGGLHHLSYHLILRQANRPLTVLVFDRHGDYLPAPPGYISCGSWLLELLKQPRVIEIWLVGSESTLRPPERLRLMSSRQLDSALRDRGLKRRRVYVSIDKDVLREADTDWGSGRLRLEWLLRWLGRLQDCCRLVGVDVCGETVPRGPWPSDAELQAIRRSEEINLALCEAVLKRSLVRTLRAS